MSDTVENKVEDRVGNTMGNKVVDTVGHKLGDKVQAKQAIIQGPRQSQNVRQQSVKSNQKSGMVRENNCRKPAILNPKLQSVSNIILYPTLW